jgi:hypothetical protein
MPELLQWANALVIPAFGYIIILERRITRLQAQVEVLLEQITGSRSTPAEHGKARASWL